MMSGLQSGSSTGRALDPESESPATGGGTSTPRPGSRPARVPALPLRHRRQPDVGSGRIWHSAEIRVNYPTRRPCEPSGACQCPARAQHLGHLSAMQSRNLHQATGARCVLTCVGAVTVRARTPVSHREVLLLDCQVRYHDITWPKSVVAVPVNASAPARETCQHLIVSSYY